MQNAGYVGINLNESRLQRIATATSLEDAQQMGLYDSLKDLFLGGIKKEAIKAVYEAMKSAPQQIKNHPDSKKLLQDFTTCRLSAHPDFSGKAQLKIKVDQHAGKWSYELTLQNHSNTTEVRTTENLDLHDGIALAAFVDCQALMSLHDYLRSNIQLNCDGMTFTEMSRLHDELLEQNTRQARGGSDRLWDTEHLRDKFSTIAGALPRLMPAPCPQTTFWAPHPARPFQEPHEYVFKIGSYTLPMLPIVDRGGSAGPTVPVNRTDQLFQALGELKFYKVPNLLLHPEIDVSKRVGGETLLHLAVTKGHIPTVRSLSGKGRQELIEARDLQGRTALSVAAGRANPSAAIELIKAGADINARDNRQWTPLMHAAKHGSADVIRALQGADVNAINSHGAPALMIAAQHGNEEAVKALIEIGADIDAVIPSLGERPLIIAMREQWNAQILLAAGADPNCATQDESRSALSLAAAHRDVGLVNKLIDVGAKVDREDKEGCTALMFAPTAAVAKALIDAGADILCLDKSGRTTLMHAASQGRADVIDALMDRLDREKRGEFYFAKDWLNFVSVHDYARAAIRDKKIVVQTLGKWERSLYDRI